MTATKSTITQTPPDDTKCESAPPNWDVLTDEIECPLCGYNLRGLSEARCPECGSQYTWGELLDPRRRTHPYLFEHHPERNAWSFWRTFVGGLNPQAFWTTLHPMQPTSRKRMSLYAGLVILLVLTCHCLSLLGRGFAYFESGFVGLGGGAAGLLWPAPQNLIHVL